MPTYTYECKKCAHSFDVFHSMSQTPKVKCEECGGPCRKLLGTGAGLIFKGSGFYETDYKRKSESKSDSSSKSTTKSESSSEAKSAPSKDTKSESKSSDKAVKAS